MKKTIRKILVGCYFVGAILLICACNDQLDIQQDYTFDLVTMPVPDKVAQGETVEIRCRLAKEGDYQQAKYAIRFFQPDGKGELRMDDGTVLLPNDLYPLEKDTFRLYYTSHCTDQQTIDVYIEDGFGQVVEKSFSFQNESDKKE